MRNFRSSGLFITNTGLWYFRTLKFHTLHVGPFINEDGIFFHIFDQKAIGIMFCLNWRKHGSFWYGHRLHVFKINYWILKKSKIQTETVVQSISALDSCFEKQGLLLEKVQMKRAPMFACSVKLHNLENWDLPESSCVSVCNNKPWLFPKCASSLLKRRHRHHAYESH